MVKAVGIEIEDREVRLTFVEGTARRHGVQVFRSAPIEAAEDGTIGPQEISKAIRAAARGIKGTRENFGLAVDTATAILREHTLPFTGDERIRQVIKFEVEGKLPHHGIDDVIVDYYVVEEGEGETKLLVAALPKARLAADLQAAAGAGCDPQVADLSAFALFNAAAAAGRIPAQGHVVLIHVQDDRTLFLLGEDGHIKQVRCLKGGAGTLTRVLERQLGPEAGELVPELAEQKESNPEDGDPQELPPSGNEEEMILVEEESRPSMELSGAEIGRELAVRQSGEFLERLSRDLRRTIFSLRLRRNPQVYLSGRFTEVPGLEGEIEQIFGGRPEALDVLGGLEHNLDLDEQEREAISDRCAISAGMALRLVGVDFVGSNFRQEELKFARTFDLIKMPLLVCLFFVLLAQSLEYIYLLRTVKGKLTAEQLYQVERMKMITSDADLAYAEYKAARPYSSSEWRTFLSRTQRAGQVGRFPKLDNLQVKRTEKTNDPHKMPAVLERIMRRTLRYLDQQLGGSSDAYSMPPSSLDAIWTTLAVVHSVQSEQKARIKVLSLGTNLRSSSRRDQRDEITVTLDLLVYCDVGNSRYADQIVQEIRRRLVQRGSQESGRHSLNPLAEVGFKSEIKAVFSGDPPKPPAAGGA